MIVAAHAAFNERRLDDLDAFVHEDVNLFLPLALGLMPDARTGVAAMRGVIARLLARAPDLHIALERAETVGDLVILVCTASATGTDAKHYHWPLRVLVAGDQRCIRRYVVRAPHADILGDAGAFGRRRASSGS